MPIDGGDPARITDYQAYWPVISPDGTMIAFEYFDEDLKKVRVAITQSEGGAPIKLFDFPEVRSLVPGGYRTGAP